MWAVYYALYTDQEPVHSFCPTDSESWCNYQQAVAQHTVHKFHHTETLSSAITDAIKPVFKSLFAPELICCLDHIPKSSIIQRRLGVEG